MTRALVSALAAAGTLALAGGSANAQPKDAQTLYGRALAATCANCHGTDGQAVPGEAMTPLRGIPKATIVSKLEAYRSGRAPATVMHQIVKGYTPEQIDSIAGYFAGLR